MSGQDGATTATDAAPSSAVPEAQPPCASPNDLPEAAGLKVKIAKVHTPSAPDAAAAASAGAGTTADMRDVVAQHSTTLEGAVGAAQPAAAGAENERSSQDPSGGRRELLHSKSAKAVLTIGTFAPEPLRSPGGSAVSPHGEAKTAPQAPAVVESAPSATSPPLPVPPVASSLSQSSASGDQSGGGVPYHHSPRTSGPGQQPRQARTSSSTYTPFVVKAPRHSHVDGLNQPPSPLMGSPVSTPTAMMFPQTPFAQHHPHFASPYGQGRYPPNPFAPDHPMSPQTSGHYGYFHPFFNNIQPFSPSMLNQHGSGGIMHMPGQLSRSNSVVAGQYGKPPPPPPPGGQPPSARASRKSASSSGDHAFSRLSESSGIAAQGQHGQGPSAATSSAPGTAPGDQQPGGGPGGYAGMIPGGPMPHFSAPGIGPGYHHGMPLHPQRSNPGAPPWGVQTSDGGDGDATNASTDGPGVQAGGVSMGGLVGGFAFQQEGMAVYPWLSMPVAGMGGMAPGQVPMTTAMPYYMLLMAGQQQPGPMHLGAMSMQGMQAMQGMGAMQPPPPPPKGFSSPGGPGDAPDASGVMGAGMPTGAFEFPDLSAGGGLPMMGHAAPLGVSGMPQMYGSVPIDLRTGRMFVPPQQHGGPGTSPAGGRGGMLGSAGAAAAAAGMAPRVPRRRNATELKVGPDGLPRLNARQRRTLRRAKERAIKGLMEAGHVLLQKHGHLAAAGADTDSSTGDTGADSGSEGSEDGDTATSGAKQRSTKAGSAGGAPQDDAPLASHHQGGPNSPGEQELFPGSSKVSDTTELYLGAAISVASGSAGPKAAAAAAEALSKAAADLEDMDISHLISHLTRKEGAVDEKLIRDLQIIQNLIGTLKIQASAGQAAQVRTSQGGYAPPAQGGYSPAPASGLAGALGTGGALGSAAKAQRPAPLQVGATAPQGSKSGSSSSLRASPSPSPNSMSPSPLDGPGVPRPQTVAAAAAAIGLLPPELQGLGQQMRAIMEGKQAVQSAAAAAAQQAQHDLANGASGVTAPANAASAAAVTQRLLASLAPVATSAPAPGALQPASGPGGALPSAVLLKESSLQSKVAAGSPDSGNDSGAAKIAAVH